LDRFVPFLVVIKSSKFFLFLLIISFHDDHLYFFTSDIILGLTKLFLIVCNIWSFNLFNKVFIVENLKLEFIKV
jgi:hypothetical protein